jgi:polyisoprenoid-binding protein YceI
MKMRYALIISSCALALSWMSCSDEAPKGDNAVIQEEQKTAKKEGTQYTVDTAASRIRFVGHGVGKNHPGIFKLSSGSVAVANKQITGGSFVINMKSLDLEQEGAMIDKKLRPHLMSGDFFDADKFATSKFEITDVQPYEKRDDDTSITEGANFRVSGNLTLRDVTKNVSFPAKIELDNATLKAKANFDIDRTQWQINYGNDKTLGDKFISEKVNIELDIQAERP